MFYKIPRTTSRLNNDYVPKHNENNYIQISYTKLKELTRNYKVDVTFVYHLRNLIKLNFCNTNSSYNSSYFVSNEFKRYVLNYLKACLN